MATTREELKKLLECPVCFEMIRPPIETCENGHGICRHCRRSLDTCGICRKKFTAATNTLLNQIVGAVPVNCKYRSKGCLKSFSVSSLSAHEEICYSRKEKCYGCNASIYLADINYHFRSCPSLPGKLVREFGANLRINNKISQQLVDQYFAVYITDIEKYFLLRFIDNREMTYFCIQYMGPDQKNARKYKFEIEIDQGLPSPNECFLSCNGLCMPYFRSMEATLKQKGIIKLDFKSIFLTDDYLASGKWDMDIKIFPLSK